MIQIKLWREQQFETLTLQQKILDQDRAVLEEKLREEAEKEKKKRIYQKEKVNRKSSVLHL